MSQAKASKNRPIAGRFHHWLPATQVTKYGCQVNAPPTLILLPVNLTVKLIILTLFFKPPSGWSLAANQHHFSLSRCDYVPHTSLSCLPSPVGICTQC